MKTSSKENKTEPIDYGEKPIKVPRFTESAGFYTSRERSRVMSKIRGKNTKPELMFRHALYHHGVRYRVDYKGLPGKPDISNKSKKFVVFIDGEFWHGYNWEEKKHKIKSNRAFWIPKIERNMQRDRENLVKLENMGFKVFRFWEQEIYKNLDKCISRVLEYLTSL
jgi:DNA mismatch endonuclease, patch repair protein